MNEQQLIETLRNLAHSVVRNEILTEYFLTQPLPVTPTLIGVKARELDKELGERTNWHERFPGLFQDDDD